jgi:thiol-disulfide isomerase/thioredoxin
MIILFYSEECEFCKKLIEYLDKNNLKNNFNLINIDKVSRIPDNVTIVPTIIDPKIEIPIEGKDALGYILNQKYFYHPTNNIDNWIKNTIPKPVIDEDEKALEKNIFPFLSFDDNSNTKNEIKPIIKSINKEVKIIPPINKRMLTLLKLRR